jgi:Fur family zinc uptake transcriptional regulator
VTRALDAATKLADERSIRMTPLRRRVLEIVSQSHRPTGAYDILATLSNERAASGERAAPPTVYRALEFLMTAGLVHRIDSLNAFVACFTPLHAHKSYFLLCERCGTAEEIEDGSLHRLLGETARRSGFAARHETVELRGTCAACRA